MPVIQGGRWQRQLQKFFGIKGEVVASELAPEIYAVHDIHDVEASDIRLLAGWNSYFAYQQVAGDATHSAQIQFVNATSDTMAVIERLEVLITSAAQPQVCSIRNYAGAALPFLTRGQLRLDYRGVGQGNTNTSACTINGVGTAASVGTEIMRIPGEQGTLVAGTTKFLAVKGIRDEIMIGPVPAPGAINNNILITQAVNNDTLQIFVWWRERKLEPSEITA